MDDIGKLNRTLALMSLWVSLLVMLTSCTTTKPQRPRTMIDDSFALDRLELVDTEGELRITDEQALTQIKEILEQSPQVDSTQQSVELSKKLRLICPNPDDSRIYVVDLTNGYATILSKRKMPLYRIHEIDRFNEILQTSGRRKPNAS